MGVQNIELNEVSDHFLERDIQNILRQLEEQNENNKFSQSETGKKRSIHHLLQKKFNLGDQEESINVSNSKILKGDLVLKRLRKAINCCHTLTRMQRQLVEIYIQSSLPNIYGKDFEANELRIKLDHDMDELFQFSLVSCPRRWGKTFLVSWFVTCYLLCVPGAAVTVYAPGKRQAIYIMELVKKNAALLEEKHGFDDFTRTKAQNNMEKFGITMSDGDTRILLCLPSKENTTRGSGGNLIIVEEAAAVSPKFFWTVIGPVLQVDTTGLICISTTQGSQNYYTKLLNITQPNGKNAFNVYKFFLACDTCTKLNIASTCKHKEDELPFWLSSSKRELVANIYRQLGETLLLEQETLGVAHSEQQPAFPHHLISELFNEDITPRANLNHERLPPNFVFFAIDPSSGGNGSDLALVSSYYDTEGNIVILGMESISAEDELDYLEDILLHIRMIKAMPLFMHSALIFAIENNTGMLSRNIRKIIALNFPAGIILSKKDFDISNVQLNHNLVGGVKTDDLVKEAMYTHTRAYLQQKRLKFIDDFITVKNPENKPMMEVREELLQKLKHQLEVYARIRKLPVDPTMNKIKITLSGKHSGKDDLCVTLQLNIYWSRLYLDRQFS